VKTIEVIQNVDSTIDIVRQNFNEDLFRFLNANYFALKVERFDGVNVGDRFKIDLTGGVVSLALQQAAKIVPAILLGGHNLENLKLIWEGEIVEAGENMGGFYFIDIGFNLPFPIRSWKHLHRSVPNTLKGGVDIIDHLEFESSISLLEMPLALGFTQMLNQRGPKYKEYFQKIVKN